MTNPIADGFCKEAGIGRTLALAGSGLRVKSREFSTRVTSAIDTAARRVGHAGARVGRALGRGSVQVTSAPVSLGARGAGAAGEVVGRATSAVGRAAIEAGSRVEGAMIGARQGAKGLAKEEKRVSALRKALRSRSKALTDLGVASKTEAKKLTSRLEIGVLGGSGVAIGGAGAYAGSREPEMRR